MRASPCIKYVLSPRLHKKCGAVCADLHTEAPHLSDNTVHYPRGALRRNQRDFWLLLVSKVTDEVCAVKGATLYFVIFCTLSIMYCFCVNTRLSITERYLSTKARMINRPKKPKDITSIVVVQPATGFAEKNTATV